MTVYDRTYMQIEQYFYDGGVGVAVAGMTATAVVKSGPQASKDASSDPQV